MTRITISHFAITGMKIQTDVIQKVVGEGEESFTLAVRTPTPEEVQAEVQIAIASLNAKLDMVQGWSGIETVDGAAVPFSPDTLRMAMRQNPDFAKRVASALHEIFEAAI